jgi:hypothetical protein
MKPSLFDLLMLPLLLRVLGHYQLYVDVQTLTQFRLWAIERRYL